MRTLALSLILLLASTPARAKLELSSGVLTPLKQGEPAPFPGVLLDAAASEAINQQLSQAKARCQAELDLAAAKAKTDAERAAAIAKARSDADTRIAEANRKAAEQTAKPLEERLRQEERGRINPALTGVLGFVVGAATTIAVAFAVQQVL